VQLLKGKKMNVSKFLKKLSVAGIAVAALTFGMGQAAASVMFDFIFGGIHAFGSGILTANDNGNGSFTAMSGAGTESVNGITETLTLLPNTSGGTGEIYSPSGFFIFDDQLFPNADPLISNGGLLFSSSTGAEVNIYSNGVDNYTFYINNGFNEPTSFTLTAVPEPATAALRGLGLLGFAVARRKSAHNKNA
jgi:hypothetical protein